MGGLFPIWFEKLGDCLSRDAMGSTSLDDLFAQVEHEYISRNPELLYQEEIINRPCLACRQFQGKSRWKGLCSSCYKRYADNPSQFDLHALRSQSRQQVARSTDEVSSARYPQALHHVYGEPSLATTSLADLFL